MMAEKITVLCVDDEPINLSVLQYILNRHYHVLICSKATEALKILQSESKISHVISDFHMPEMDGLEFIKLAKVLHPSVAFHILSGFQDNPEINTALDEGLILNYFTKPIEKDKIIQSIQ